MWGPGVYHYAQPPQQGQQEQQQGQQQGRHRDAYHGMMNGRPQGKGCLLWSDGSRDTGQVSAATCALFALCWPSPFSSFRVVSRLWSQHTLPPACVQFDGSNCYLRLEEGAVAGVLMVAADNARAARGAAAEAERQVLAQPGLLPPDGLALQLLTAALQAAAPEVAC